MKRIPTSLIKPRMLSAGSGNHPQNHEKTRTAIVDSDLALPRWNAQWIWPAHSDPRPKNSYALFRKTFTLNDPVGTKIFISADSRYQLYVNGRFVARGQPQSQPYFQYYNQHDLADYLKPGENCIGIIVYHLGTNLLNRGGLLAEVVAAEGQTILATSDAWPARLCDAWAANTYFFRMNHYAPFQEHFDARKFPYRDFPNAAIPPPILAPWK